MFLYVLLLYKSDRTSNVKCHCENQHIVIHSNTLFLVCYCIHNPLGYGPSTATGANGFGSGEMLQAFLAEVIFTFVFVLVVLGSTDSKKGAGNFAGLAIGLTLVLVHIVCIPITGTSVNPARSFGPALFQGGEALSQLWLFIVAPMLGAALSAGVWKVLSLEEN